MKRYTSKEIDKYLNEIDTLDHSIFTDLQSDERKVVQTLLKKHQRRITANQLMKEKHLEMQRFEDELYAKGIEWIAGIDEVGRGPLAGPVVAAAVILKPYDQHLIGVNDSKQLSFAKRKEFSDLIKEQAIAFRIAEVDAKMIDELNIYEASRTAMLQAVEGLQIQPQHLLIDAMEINSSIPQTKIIKGDQRSLSIAAASILAKVHRDELMMTYSEIYPEFAFDKHMGYGTKKHLEALMAYGYTPIHRQSFSPVASTLKKYSN